MSGPGTRLADRYRLTARVGSGGMGEVWQATDELLGRTVAVKLMRSELVAEPGFAERFLAEARTMATIKHRGVVAIYDFHGDAAGAFLVMEFIEGESLAALLGRTGRLDAQRTMSLLAQAADALQAAHDRGVVHRDIKPGNLLVTPDDTLVLTDFGIARSAATSPLTATGAVIGTPSYLAPEQVLGQPASPRSDLYALGVVGYECLTGRRPFGGENPFEIAVKRLREPPPTIATEAPVAVVAVIDQALASDPDHRWRSAAELANGARRAIQPGTGYPPEPTHRGYRSGRAALPGSAVPAPAPTPPAPAPDPTAVAAPAAAPGPAAGVRSEPPTASPPPPARPTPPPWAVPPPRPVPVTLASSLLLVTGLSLVFYGGATLSVLDDAVAVISAHAGEPWRDGAGVTGLVLVALTGLLGLIYLLLAVQVYRGRPGARGWTFTLGVPLLCCCAPGWWYGRAGEWTQTESGAALTADLDRIAPDWYQPLTGLWVTGGVVALLVGLMLLALPAAGRFFQPRRPAFYYPYYPYHYGYPPRP